jgi:hypothetical protein
VFQKLLVPIGSNSTWNITNPFFITMVDADIADEVARLLSFPLQDFLFKGKIK